MQAAFMTFMEFILVVTYIKCLQMHKHVSAGKVCDADNHYRKKKYLKERENGYETLNKIKWIN